MTGENGQLITVKHIVPDVYVHPTETQITSNNLADNASSKPHYVRHI